MREIEGPRHGLNGTVQAVGEGGRWNQDRAHGVRRRREPPAITDGQLLFSGLCYPPRACADTMHLGLTPDDLLEDGCW